MEHPERINHIINYEFSEWCVINLKNTYLGEGLPVVNAIKNIHQRERL